MVDHDGDQTSVTLLPPPPQDVRTTRCYFRPFFGRVEHLKLVNKDNQAMKLIIL